MNIKPYLAWLKEETLPGIWSKGIALARSAKAEVVSLKEGASAEIKFKLQTGERLLAYTVTLWPQDEDAFCSCESKAQPCHHVVATAQIYDQGRATEPQAGENSNSVQYLWSLDKNLNPPRLVLLRSLGGNPLNTSLISLIGGIESGRIAQPLPSTTSIDLQIDEVLMKSKEIGQKLDWPKLLKLIIELPPILVTGTALKFTVNLNPPRTRLFIDATQTHAEISFRVEWPEFTPLAEGIALHGESLFLQPAGADLRTEPLPALKAAELENFLLEKLPRLKEHFDVQIQGQLPELMDSKLALTLKMDRLASKEDHLVVTPILHYTTPSGKMVRIMDGKLDTAILDQEGLKEIPRRDRASETALVQKLRRELNLSINQATSFHGSEALQFTEKLSATSWASEFKNNEAILESYQNDQVYEPHLELRGERLNLYFTNRKGEKVQIPEAQLIRYREDPDRPIMDSLKEYGKIPEDIWNELGDEILKLVARSAQEPLQKMDLMIAQGLVQEVEGTLPERTVIDLPIEHSLFEKLRPYQRFGVEWILSHLKNKSSRGALLADEMGLGKTIQTIAALQTPALIVVPTSLLSNWKAELQRFRPELRVNVYHGQARKYLEAGLETDVVLTTYGVLRQEAEEFVTRGLGPQPFAMMVMDEAHQLRNRETQSTQAVIQIPAAFKLALSGTPIQNHLRDLHTLFCIIQPKLFEDRDDFFAALEKPRLFSAKTASFILRRLKSDVLKELPAKTQMLHPVTFTEDEQQTYNVTLMAAKKEIAEKLQDSGANSLTLFEVLLRARQICDHRALFLPEHASAISSKTTALSDLLSELTENGHSVLVYSQWTKYLDIIEAMLPVGIPGIPYERLDGSTSNRSKVIEAFTNAEGPTVFLLSLHAGGVGLNLTKADHVIFCEPWWNPFVELQAEDRVHRMGQEKPVFIHRLIAQGSIEEGMLKLQEKKKSLQAALTVEDVKELIYMDPKWV